MMKNLTNTYKRIVAWWSPLPFDMKLSGLALTLAYIGLIALWWSV